MLWIVVISYMLQNIMHKSCGYNLLFSNKRRKLRKAIVFKKENSPIIFLVVNIFIVKCFFLLIYVWHILVCDSLGVFFLEPLFS